MSFLDSLFGEYGGDLAIDLGTANTLVAVRGQGIVINEPSVVAIDKSESRVLAVGADAKRMIGRTPGSIIAERPLKDGVIADFDVTEVMLRYFIEKARGTHYPVVAAPARRRLRPLRRHVRREARGLRGHDLRRCPPGLSHRGAHGRRDRRRSSHRGPPPGPWSSTSAAAPPRWAVISMGGIVVSQSIRTAGDEFDQTILQHVRDAYNLSIGERTAEDIKIKVGSAGAARRGARRRGQRPRRHERPSQVRPHRERGDPPRARPTARRGHQGRQGRPGRHPPPDLASDPHVLRILLTGGGGLLRGLDQRLREETGVPVNVSPHRARERRQRLRQGSRGKRALRRLRPDRELGEHAALTRRAGPQRPTLANSRQASGGRALIACVVISPRPLHREQPHG